MWILKLFKLLFYSLFVLILRPFVKIKENRVVLWSNYFNLYGCNPKAIADYIVKNYPSEFEVYFVLKKIPGDLYINDKIIIIRPETLKYFKVICSAKFVITNCRLWYNTYFIKRKGQKYIQTWHSSMRLKKIEKDAEENLPFTYKLAAKIDSYFCDFIISGSEFSTVIIQRAFWLHKAKILEYGTPRNDFFFLSTSQIIDKIKYSLNIPKDKKIILYAPTFRNSSLLEAYNMDYNLILKTIEEKINQSCILIIKYHPNLLVVLEEMKEQIISDKIIDLTKYHDMQNLLLISDILITDYSSTMFDFALMKKVCFIYASDYCTYDRGTYFQLDSLPFPFSYNNEGLIEQINKFDLAKYKKELNVFNAKIGFFEDGNASSRLVKYMLKIKK